MAATFPVDRTPNWGAMISPAQWTRTYAEMQEADFVAVPAYDAAALTTPMEELRKDRRRHAAEITAKLFYSTRYCGRYDVDADEFTGTHCAIDMKVPVGTPVRAVLEGQVYAVRRKEPLGLHVILAHDAGCRRYFSVYGHLDTAVVAAGDRVAEGATIGETGRSGAESPHLHFQVDRDIGTLPYVPYHPDAPPTRAEAMARSVHPLDFLRLASTAGIADASCAP